MNLQKMNEKDLEKFERSVIKYRKKKQYRIEHQSMPAIILTLVFYGMYFGGLLITLLVKIAIYGTSDDISQTWWTLLLMIPSVLFGVWFVYHYDVPKSVYK